MKQSEFSPDERRALEHLADALIPAAPGCLSASAAGIGRDLLDRIAEHVPERLWLLRHAIGQAATPAAALARLRGEDAAAYDLFCETIAAAYFMSDTVRAQVAYPGRVAVPARIDVTDIEDLLLPVLERGFAPRAVPA
jgi:hypothetical protein